MEDKRYDPYTGYEIKDEDSTQKYNAQNEMDANMKINDAQKWLEKRRKIEYEERM